MNKYKQITPAELYQMHDDILKRSFGMKGCVPGVTAERVINCIIACQLYSDRKNIETAAAWYAIIIIGSHLFTDGNKRTACIAMITFLKINGYDFDPPHYQLAQKMLLIKEAKITINLFADWMGHYTKKLI